jgi:hypothetical protein
MARAYFVASVLVILAVSTAFLIRVQAVEYVPGVKVGDWIKYGQLTITWTGNGTEPSSITEEKKVSWARITVITISGPIVNINETVHYNNSTEILENGTEDVSGGAQYTSFPFVIARNLTAGDPIITQTGSAQINQTTTRTYASASRRVNILNLTTTYQDQTTVSTFYFDQSTGFMVELYSKDAYQVRDLIATETNMWSPDLLGLLTNNLIYIIAGIIIIITVIAAAIALRRKKPSIPPPPPPAQNAQTLVPS